MNAINGTSIDRLLNSLGAISILTNIRQDGDSTERIQEAIDTCPVDCIHWVPFESLEALKRDLVRQNLQARPQG